MRYATPQTLATKGFERGYAIPCSLFPLWGAVVVAPQRRNFKTYPKKTNLGALPQTPHAF